MMSAESCPFCFVPVNPKEPRVARAVLMWEYPETGDGVNAEPTGWYAHGKCVAVRELARNLIRNEAGCSPTFFAQGARDSLR